MLDYTDQNNSATLIFFQGVSVDPKKLWNYHEDLITSLFKDNGVFVTAFVFDYGPTNQGMANHLGIKASKTETNVTIPHPGDPERVLVLSTDPSHSLKGLKRMSLNYEIELPDT